jgi:outer membrane protein OmpA-like peptidoglycan-associated protein
MKRQKRLGLILGVLLLAITMISFQEIKDHPVIKPIPGFTLVDSEFKNFASYTFAIPQKESYVEKDVRGKYWFLYYEYQKGDRTFSELEIMENYKQAALEKGGKILKEDEPKLDFTVPHPKSGTIWVHLHAWTDSYELYIIEEEGFKKRLDFSAEEMKKELDSAGHVAIYGIYFDFDKSDLKIGSEKMLTEIVKLLLNHPDLKIEIQGHTDSTGTRDYNLKLSERRANTVKSYLALYGIDPARLTTRGYGPDEPVSTNDTEEGRALNRRVELKKL